MGQALGVDGKMAKQQVAKSQKSRDDFIREAFALMAEAGTADALTIDLLCKRLAVSKGSFYWHFKGRGPLIEALVESWSGQFQTAIHAALEMQTQDNGRSVVEEITHFWLGSNMSDIDRVMRHWAQHDPRVAEAVCSADRLFLDFLRHGIESLGFTAKEAHRRARLMMSIGIAEPALSHLPRADDIEQEMTWVLKQILEIG